MSAIQKVIKCLCSCLLKQKQKICFKQQADQHHNLKINSELNEFFRRDEIKDTKNEQNKQFYKIHNNQKNQIDVATQYFSNELLIKQQQNKQTQFQYLNSMPKSHPYYHLFQDKLKNLHKIFIINQPKQSIVSPDTKYPLKMYCINQGKNNIFKYFFTFPTNVQEYDRISTDFKLQQFFDTNIQSFHQILDDDLPQNTKLIYLAYKKILLIASRDFQYIRYKFEKQNQHWIICVSDMSRPNKPQKTRGQIIFTATKIIESGSQIQVSVYSQIDMKMNIRHDMAKNRGLSQIRKYLDKVYDHIVKIQEII